ncbi:Branched-chain amino acid transport ATP-binding protein livG (plasmid) [Mycetohabitans rhizoxinica HKI 454]|uniref:Branched-chain amino acid transport ATP-binding protein livG n=1 Tax=Mycetohabitans rhizoxinica (strain DSM 19002 / CIP 109453 / HKI 454) TaxID=882378 RepID=E5AU10_MYCRK|nr:Branched-chain amino acid transport ATP-binding protein livG [Mycetohabitans rhizoxinica HKI 454]
MAVIENLLAAQHRLTQSGLLRGLLATPVYRRVERDALKRAARWLERMVLDLRYHSRDSRRGRDGVSGRAEREQRTAGGRSRLRSGNRPRGAGRYRREFAG